MRKFSTLGLISCAAALSFFCASAVMADGPAGNTALSIVAASR
ncbi:hypothetical protein [Herminiimonas sp.]|nr:hypothetical protein [Herminiimonas sp.]MDO8305098.1 hypothetical protein [Herminiimonas sp.]